ncbi:extracellular solute-binding protein [Streptomyces ipomoeae]|uniref:ABC transporter, substrate-binding protein n=2 Tax=Streptomyces ipomoeae TaxID=103232 RepID=L1L383_9ACTN|nr:extracellular solute-binding protein [Streptomyces ipomoeae]EKX67078.1 ABC transporter, substrate-binding protein [Streptomyces ipomoeae 91-03]MDX2695787.1 extracellular solute-binding protein [Streptomyces ipomoeae]MDX2820495.1 extracellular solute-binding protein [Streptomyces ipomoeae]MDX2838484.1 extracellular solute-binding protein [Streptomyces ipomoeae]MDX2875627.1 extracellular solute-binding protein [Streptomyces ipomoeae]
MNSNSPRRRFARIAVAGMALTGLLTACGGSDSGDGGDSSASGPVTLPFWGWANGQENLVKMFNASHKDVQLKYTKVTDQLTMQKQLSNAVKAGNAPCLVQNTAEYVTTWVSQGALADITEYVGSSKDKFNAGAWAGVQVQGKVYGVPTSSAPAFTIYRTDIFKKYGLKAPATWDDFIAAGKVLKKHGIHITNYAGEDPSTLEVLAMQAGAHWYAIDGDSWKVNFQDEGTLKAAKVIQEIIDNDLNSKLSFADYAAVQRNYDKGGTATRQISTWQMSGMVQNFTDSFGKWALSPWPTYKGEAAKTPAGTNQSGGMNLVTEQCKYKKQAAEAALWLSTDTGAVKSMASPETGSGVMPGLADSDSYVAEAISEKLLGDNYEPGKKIVTDSLGTVTDDWVFGPNWTAMFTELQSQWGKVVSKELKVTDLLAHMQEWTVKDLKSRGINVEG